MPCGFISPRDGSNSLAMFDYRVARHRYAMLLASPPPTSADSSVGMWIVSIFKMRLVDSPARCTEGNSSLPSRVWI